MERKSQNLEFKSSQKLSTKSEDCLERRSHNLFTLSRSNCSSGGDIATAATTTAINAINAAKLEGVQCNASFQNLSSLSCKSNFSEEQFEDAAEQSEDSTMHCEGHLLHVDPKFGVSTNRGFHYNEVSSKLKAELCKYKKELKAYNNTTKDLEEKYLKINSELNEMQGKHDRFLANRKCASAVNELESYSDSSSSSSMVGSEYSLQRKYTQVFQRGSSFLTMMPPAGIQPSTENIAMQLKKQATVEKDAGQQQRKRRKAPGSHSSAADFGSSYSNKYNTSQTSSKTKTHQSKRKPDNKENEPPFGGCSVHGHQTAGLKDIYEVLKTVINTNNKSQPAPNVDLKDLHATINSLQNEQTQFRSIIQQQQNCLQDYHTRCVKAQHIMQTQQVEIEKLNSNNHQLESEISSGMDQLRVKIDTKLKDVGHLPQMVRDEQTKYERVSKENIVLSERLRLLQDEAAQLKVKIDELGRRKMTTISRLKTAERDLKIFKNYNTALKHEKRKLHEELMKVNEQLDSVQNTNKKSLTRQREQSEKQRRDLQKRVFELELKLSRSQNSTTSLIQERDTLIAELQTQLNTLVHNFEVSQKHIRVLRRHIYSMSGVNINTKGRIDSI